MTDMNGSISPPAARSTRRRLLAPIVLALCCAATYCLGLALKSEPTAKEGLVVADEHLNFGSVWEDKRFQFPLPVENSTAEDIEIMEFHSSCNCVAIDPPTLLVQAGKKADLRVTLDLTKRYPDEANLPVRDVSVEIVPRIHGRSHPHSGWTLRGRVKSAFTLSPTSLYFWEGLRKGEPFSPGVVSVTCHTPIEAITARCDPSRASAVVTKASDNARTFYLTVTPQDSLPIGRFSIEVTISATTHNKERIPDLFLPVEGIVNGDIELFPGIINFGPRLIGEKVRETVVIRSRRGGSFEVLGTECASPDIAIRPAASSANDCQLFHLEQIVSHQGHHSDSVGFIVKGQVEGIATLRLEVSYYGMAAK